MYFKNLEFFRHLFGIREPSLDQEEQYEACNDPIAYIQSLTLRQQLVRFCDKFINRNTLEFYTDGSLNNSPLVNVQMEGAWIESNDPQNDNCIFTCKDFASSSRSEAFAIIATLV